MAVCVCVMDLSKLMVTGALKVFPANMEAGVGTVCVCSVCREYSGYEFVDTGFNAVLVEETGSRLESMLDICLLCSAFNLL